MRERERERERAERSERERERERERGKEREREGSGREREREREKGGRKGGRIFVSNGICYKKLIFTRIVDITYIFRHGYEMW